MIKLIIDTDPGIDDAVALAIALFSNKVDIKLITTVAGNVEIEKVTLNTRKLLKFFNKENIPVARGMKEPIINKLRTASDIHGESGLSGFDFEDPTVPEIKENAVEAMKKILMESEEKITILALGPLTNIGLLLKIYPEVKEKIERIVFMGGSLTRGNKGVMSEFNIDVDPEAAKIVLDSSLNIVMLPLDIGLKAEIYPEDSEKIRLQNKTGEMVYSLFKKYRSGSFKKGVRMYDSTAIAFILNEEIFTYDKYFVDVELNFSYTRGTTIVDLKDYLKREKNVTVVTDVDSNMFRKFLIDGLKNSI